MVRRLVRFIRDAGLTHFAYRCDREASVTAMIDEACSILGRSCQKVTSESDPSSFQYPLAAVEDDEPDAPTEIPPTPVIEVPVVAVPELTHPGESASNGLAERSVGILEDYVRTLLLALKVNLGCNIDIEHPIVDGVVGHASYLLTKYQLGNDTKTAYGRRHGKETREIICQFGREDTLVHSKTPPK